MNKRINRELCRAGRVPLYAVILIAVFAAAVVFSATFFPMRYVAAREAERYERELDAYRDGTLVADGRYDAARLAEILDYLQKNSIYGLPDSDALTEAMIEAVLDAMGDRHGTYFNAEEYVAYREELNGTAYGIGVTVTKSQDGYIEVLYVHPDSPMASAGGTVGDLITAVDGESVLTKGYDKALALIAGENGTAVTLTVMRGGESVTLTAVRGAYTKQTVISRQLDANGKRLGYVMVTGFDGNTFEQFQDAVSGLEAAGVEGFIFDMRNNPGGLLHEVVEVIAYVLPDGEIVHVDYASERLSDYTVTARDGKLLTGSSSEDFAEGRHEIAVPIAVLVNGGTASAAELFTAALRDYADNELIDATIIGTETYGKGTVQTTDTAPCESGTALKISVAYYNPPCNESYDGEGITPNDRVELPSGLEGVSIFKLTDETDTQLAAAIRALTD